MDKYYVNNGTDYNGNHEVHKDGCSRMPSDKKDLGDHPDCHTAVKKAKDTYSNSDGCYYCCKDCHTS